MSSIWEKSIIIEIFYSTVITTYKCLCQYISYSSQKIIIFPLLLNNNKDKIELEDILNVYSKYDMIEFNNVSSIV